jgi:SpoIID/LytB domain protein
MAVGPRPAAAYPTTNVTVAGHGYGHGRGMGQWGAYGYAQAGWSAAQILDHFYGGTVAGSVGNPLVAGVQLQAEDHKVTAVAAANGGVVSDRFTGAHAAWLVVRVGTNAFDVYAGTSCSDVTARSANSANKLGTVTGEVKLFPPRDTNARGAAAADALQLCDTGRHYRGEIHAVDAGGFQATTDWLAVNSYVYGVVPKEVPASWPAAALQAQAVAARSYALGRRWSSIAQMCDTTSCQAFGGMDGEDGRSNDAVDATSGQARMTAGNVVATEYSSSSGGWTAGGTFPAVVDDGDANSANPNHNWQVSIPVSSIENHYGLGTLTNLTVTSRNGLGDFGGRVLSMRLDFSGGSTTVSGSAFQSAFGLRSNWFSFGSDRAFEGPSGGVSGYRVAGPDGGIFTFGTAQYYGSTGGMHLNRPILGMAGTPTGHGYWLVAGDGGIFPFGDAPGLGSTGGMRLNQPVVGMAASPSGRGYWLVAADGGIFPFGDAPGLGSTGGMRLNQPIVGMAATPTGRGYWLVAKDGGIFPFGDAPGIGSLGNLRLNQPIVAMAATPSGRGYWLLAGDGGIFPFGDAPGSGSLPGNGVSDRAVAMVGTNTGGGYLVLGAGGEVYDFGDAPWMGGVPEIVAGYQGGAVGLTTVGP